MLLPPLPRRSCAIPKFPWSRNTKKRSSPTKVRCRRRMSGTSAARRSPPPQPPLPRATPRVPPNAANPNSTCHGGQHRRRRHRLPGHPAPPPQPNRRRGRRVRVISTTCGRPTSPKPAKLLLQAGRGRSRLSCRRGKARRRKCEAARRGRAAPGRHPQIGRGRRHGLHTLCRRFDRSRIAARHVALRVDQRTAQPPFQERDRQRVCVAAPPCPCAALFLSAESAAGAARFGNIKAIIKV